jgi:hypothetical protein
MNKLEIFQEVYGKDYVFTETELSRLLKVTELIVRECVSIADRRGAYEVMDGILEHFGVE